MAKINSKGKGDKFEREVSKFLSGHFKDILKVDNAFQRNRSSGAYLGGKNSHRAIGMLEEQKIVGDIITPSNFVYEIECKHYRTPPTYKQLITGKIAQWDKWIKQALSDVKTSGKYSMMLFIKYNLNPEIIIVEKTKFPLEEIKPVYYYDKSFAVISYDLFKVIPKDKFFKQKQGE